MGKLKKPQKVPKPVQQPEATVEEESEDDAADMMDMVEEDDLSFLTSAVSNKSYRLLEDINNVDP